MYGRILADVCYDGTTSLSENIFQNNHAIKNPWYHYHANKINTCDISELLRHIKKKESTHCDQMETPSKPRNILNLFGNKKKIADKEQPGEAQQVKNCKTFNFLGLFKKK